MRPIIDSNFDCILSQATTVLQAPLEGKIESFCISYLSTASVKEFLGKCDPKIGEFKGP